MAKKEEAAKIPSGLKFVFGGAAGMGACCFSQPFDFLKNRMQMSGEGGAAREHKGTFDAIKNIVRKEGILGFYNGLSAGLLRQGTYTTLRLGFYTWLFEHFSSPDKPPGFVLKATLGLTAGAVSSFMCNPTEIGLIRMTIDGRMPKEQQRGYKNVFDVLIRVTREEGILTLWRGCGPTVGRAMVVNAAQLGTYSQAKQLLLATGLIGDNILTHFGASMIAALACTTASMPVDIAKTRVQNMRVVNGVPEYKGTLDVWMKVTRKEGVFALWKGFTPYFMRLGPHTVLVFVFLEQLNSMYFKYVLGVEGKGAI
jgi:solute carrier family 25 oxoglutarate transporter 11